MLDVQKIRSRSPARADFGRVLSTDGYASSSANTSPMIFVAS